MCCWQLEYNHLLGEMSTNIGQWTEIRHLFWLKQGRALTFLVAAQGLLEIRLQSSV